MQVAVIGAGAIGAVVAAASLDAGHDVTVCVRTPVTSLTLEKDGATRTLPVTLVADPGSVPEPVDVVWVTTKATDVAGTAPWLERLCRPTTLVAAVQNGLDHEANLAPLVPSGRIVPVLAYIAAERLAPGVVHHRTGNRLVVPAGPDREALAEVTGVGLKVVGVENFEAAKWLKLLGNLAVNPITALTLRRIEVLKEPAVEELAVSILEEAARVAAAEGVTITPDEIALTMTRIGQYDPDVGSSMLYDRLAGNPLEHAAITGALVRRADQHGIPVPVNRTLLALLDALGPAPGR